jgi:4-amino-4-deoxy-L-arabinose transferase-like glycosyltransferase
VLNQLSFNSRCAAWLLAILLGHSLLHFAMGWVLGLSGDEAHYALYAAHLDASYYDHPPLVGWIQWPLVAFNAPEGILRLIPEALWVVTGLLIFATARRLHAVFTPTAGSADAAGLWAVLAYSLSPVLHILGIGLLPDTLLMLFTAAIVWQTLRLFDTARAQRQLEWLLLGALLGLAGLAKYTAIFVALPVLVCLLAVHGRRLLLRPAPWGALLLAVVLVLPVFVWNAQHDWISFAYQLHHGSGSQWQWSPMLQFLLAQLLLYPLLVWGALALRGLGGGKFLHRPQIWLLGFFALPFSVLMILSGGGSGLPHWTAPAWVALAPFAGVGLAALWSNGRRRIIAVLAVLQTAFCLIMYTLMLLAGPTWMSSSEQPEAINPFTDFYGWDTAGHKAQQLAREHQINRLAVQNWTLASRLAWYARPLPVHVLDPAFDQFSLWSGDLPLDSDAVLMDWSQMAYKLPVGEGRFERCEPLDTLAVERAGRTVSRFAFFHCTHWGGKPVPQRLDEP